MTVRWKPLLILSGLFVVVAMTGVLAMVLVLAPGTNPLDSARAARKARNYKHAEILYRQALQRDGRNAKLLQEVASLYADWPEESAAEDAKHRLLRLKNLADAAKYGKQLAEPRRLLLVDAMQQDDAVESARLAKELLALDPHSTDAHYVLAADALSGNPPNVEEARTHLDELAHESPRRIRTDWLGARIAEATKDDAQLQTILDRVRTLPLGAELEPVDGMALLRLRAMDAMRAADPGVLSERVNALRADAVRFAGAKELSATRIAELSLELERVQKQLTQVAAKANATEKSRADQLGDSIEEVAETAFKKALESSKSTDLRVYQAYAEHLLSRGHKQRCIEVVNQALKLPIASMPALLESVMSLREIAIKAALADSDNKDRFAVAEPYIRDLLASKVAYYEGLGHLFQGAIDLERSGSSGAAPAPFDEAATPAQAKLREEALNHLRTAAERLPRLAAAQALYGVGLILSEETALGRQYLQTAKNLGNLEPRYQIWAAWSVVQAGYPEEAEPIVASLLEEIGKGTVPHELEGPLHLLKGQIYQARREPADLKLALAEYDKAVAGGQAITPAVQLRLAQIDAMLGQSDKALERIAKLRASGEAGAAVEHLAVLTLNESRREAEARTVLAAARQRYPQSGELAALEAALLVKAKKLEDADKVLADFLTRNPDNFAVVQLRAKLLAEELNRGDEARELLTRAAEQGRNSAPLVQLATLELERRDLEAVRRTIAKIRGRWKEAAAADLLEAQLAIAQGDLAAASTHFEEALKKDPNNKVVLLAKAEIDRQTGASDDAARALESITRDRPVKELDSGISLMTAAQSALAAQAIEDGDYDGAIHRLEDLLKGRDAGLMARPARWQLVAARAAKGDWPAAKREIAALINDKQTPATLEERVRAANFYRVHNEDAAAKAQLDYVLQQEAAQPQAVAVRAFMLVNGQPPRTAEAGELLRKAIAVSKAPPAVFYLMLAAVENATPPESDGLARARAAIDQGLAKHPDSLDLVRAKYRVVRLMQNKQAALAVVEQKAKSDPKGPFRRLLADVYREEEEYGKAEQEVRSLLQDNPKDRQLAAGLVRLVAAQAAQAADRGDRGREKAFNDEATRLIRQDRAQFPNDLAFPQVECELAARRGDVSRGIAIAEEVDALDRHSPAGPLLLARLYTAVGRTNDVAKAYKEALKRSPRQPQVRLALAQVSLSLADAEEALAQANKVLESEPGQPSAVLLKARALAIREASADQAATNRAEALALLKGLIEKQPKLVDAYHLTAEIEMMRKHRAEAVAGLEECLKAAPDDANGAGLLVQILTEPREQGEPPSTADLQRAKDVAERFGGPDQKGPFCLALSIGFQRANRFEMALPWAEKAAARLNNPAAHLNFGGLLLAVGEATTEKNQSRALVERALGQYDLALKAQPDSVEAVNNKAWILHRYLGNHQAALDLAMGMLRRTDRSRLPGEFFDTLGAIQEALGQTQEAEQSYLEGLRKAPDQPVLNYHMGRLLAGDPERAGRARGYLEKAQSSAVRLSPSHAAEVDTLLRRVSQ